MPDEPNDNNEQISNTPNYDTFSGKNKKNETPENVEENLSEGAPLSDKLDTPIVQEEKNIETVGSIDMDTKQNDSSNIPDQNLNSEPSPELSDNSGQLSEKNDAMDNSLTDKVTETVAPNDKNPEPDSQTSFASEPIVNKDIPLTATPTGSDIRPEQASTKFGFIKNKKIIIAAVIAAVVILLGTGSVFAYNMYQNPEKILADSLINVFTVKKVQYTGKLTINVDNGNEDEGINTTVNIKSKLLEAGVQHHNASLTISYRKESYSVDGDTMYGDNGDLYFRVSKLKELAPKIEKLLNLDSNTVIKAAVDKLVSRIDNVWIKVSTTDLDGINKDASNVKKCVNKAIDDFKNDTSAINEISDLYRKNPYIVVKEDKGQVDGNFVYEVKPDLAAGKRFLISLKNTKIYKSLHDCDKNIVIDEDDVNDLEETIDTDYVKIKSSYILSIGVWSHQINKFEQSYKQTTTSRWSNSSTTVDQALLITPDYNSDIKVEIPSKSITLTQLKTYFEEFIQSISSA